MNPKAVCREVYCPGQFSWVHQEPPSPSVKSKAWKQAVAVAQFASLWAQHGLGEDYSRGANFYHANHVRPRWVEKQAQVALIGTHIFYRGKYSGCTKKE
jgi:spore germination cell wall hydrolase CwlJ-like protein